MEVQELQGSLTDRTTAAMVCDERYSCLIMPFLEMQRESSCSIKNTPKAYEQGEPPKQQSIIEFDCRGLEFTSFSPEVSKAIVLINYEIWTEQCVLGRMASRWFRV